jgi:hypothetical protein
MPFGGASPPNDMMSTTRQRYNARTCCAQKGRVISCTTGQRYSVRTRCAERGD